MRHPWLPGSAQCMRLFGEQRVRLCLQDGFAAGANQGWQQHPGGTRHRCRWQQVWMLLDGLLLTESGNCTIMWRQQYAAAIAASFHDFITSGFPKRYTCCHWDNCLATANPSAAAACKQLMHLINYKLARAPVSIVSVGGFLANSSHSMPDHLHRYHCCAYCTSSRCMDFLL